MNVVAEIVCKLPKMTDGRETSFKNTQTLPISEVRQSKSDFLEVRATVALCLSLKETFNDLN